MKLAARLVPPIFGLLVALCFGAAQAQAAPQQHLTPSLVADTSAVAPGKVFTVGLLLKMDPGWHAYWQHPGGPGSAPEVEWTLPEGFKAGAISWPLPTMHFADGILNFVYQDEVLLPVEITPPANLPAGALSLRAKVRWLVCEKVCVPGDGEVSLKLAAGGAAAPANVELFAKWRAQLPKTTAPPAVTWDVSNPKLVSITIQGLSPEQTPEFFPIAPGAAEPQEPKVSGPDASGARTIAYPLDPPAPAGAKWRGLLVVKKGAEREGWYIASDTPPRHRGCFARECGDARREHAADWWQHPA